MSYRYTATFTTVAHVVNPSEQDRFVAKASLRPLRSILPADVDPENDPDLLYISANGAVAGLMNLNNHAISPEAAIAVHRSARNKYISIDHDREKVVGVILYPALSRYGSNEPLSDEDALATKEPFNMSFAGVLWKAITPLMTKYITQQGDSTAPESLSMSWEICYNDYDIGVGSRNVFDATVIAADDPRFALHEKMLRDNGGEGKDPSGREVFRIIKSDAILLGYSIVPRPAAAVKGILPITNEQPEPATASVESELLVQLPEAQRSFFAAAPDSIAGCYICNMTMKDGTIRANVPVFQGGYVPRSIEVEQVQFVVLASKSEEKSINASDTRVIQHTPNPMKIEKLDQLTSEWSEIRKLESAASVVSFVEAIQNGSAEYVKQLEAKENLLKTTQEAKAAAEARVLEVEASLAAVKKDLDAIRVAQASAEAQQKFQERMTAMDEEFELDAEDRKIVASDIKDLDDTAFAAYMDKCKKLMDDKSKSKRKAKAAAVSAPPTVVVDPKQAIASVVETPGQTVVPNTVQTDIKLVDQMKAAFAASMKMDGKPISEIGKKKTS